MKRIGIAASKMAKGNLALYNLYVVLISFLFSSFIFIVAGASVVLALALIEYMASEVMALGPKQDSSFILTVCMVSLTVVVTLLTLFVISSNIRFSKNKAFLREDS